MCVQMLELGAEESPFDRILVKMDGIMNFLRTGFSDFFQFDSVQELSGAGMTLHRSRYHSFWRETASKSWREAHQQVIDSFGPLAKSSRTKLFVYAAADTSELCRLGELLEELTVHFGSDIYLAVFVGGQTEARTVSVEDNCRILVHFITEAVCSKSDGSQYCEPLKRSLDWVVGRAMRASVVTDFAALQSLAHDAKANLMVPGGFSAFVEPAEQDEVESPFVLPSKIPEQARTSAKLPGPATSPTPARSPVTIASAATSPNR